MEVFGIEAGSSSDYFTLDFSIIGGVGFKDGFDLLAGLFGIFGGGKTETQFEGADGSEDVSCPGTSRETIDTSDRELRLPSLVGETDQGVFTDRVTVSYKGELELASAQESRVLLEFCLSVLGDSYLEVVDYLASLHVFHPVQQLPNDSEGTRHQSRSQTRMDSLLEDSDGKFGHQVSSETGGEPETVVVIGSRVETDDIVHLGERSLQMG